jgi:hypothetical protein
MYLHTFPSQQLSNTFIQSKLTQNLHTRCSLQNENKITTVRDQICWTRQQESKLHNAFALLGYYMA